MSDKIPLQGQTMKYGKIGGLHVCMHPAAAPSAQEWSDYVADLERVIMEIHGVFVITYGGGPNSLQRKQLTTMYQRATRMPPVAVVSPSPAIRAILTAMNFFTSRQIKMFPPQALDDATAYLSADPGEKKLLQMALSEQAGWLGTNANDFRANA